MTSFALHPRDYVTLYRLALRRLDSPEAYQSFQRFQGALLVKFLQSRGVELEGRRVLDLACGLGGYSLALQEAGARILGADRFPDPIAAGVGLICADALRLPLGAEQFDVVICASLIEHVPAPADLIRELHRVLRVGGAAYLSFPPFYTPIGGHQFSPFHLLGERMAIKMNRVKELYRGRRWLQAHYPEAPGSFAQAFGDWGLYPLSISRVEAILNGFSFQIAERSTRWLPVDFSGLPVVREFLTWHVQFLLRKTHPLPERELASHAAR
jgi:SAM-dependent methyltransferase